MGKWWKQNSLAAEHVSFIIEGADLKTLVAEVAVTALLECSIIFINSYIHVTPNRMMITCM